jgi:DNA-binding NtrC family response regulator
MRKVEQPSMLRSRFKCYACGTVATWKKQEGQFLRKLVECAPRELIVRFRAGPARAKASVQMIDYKKLDFVIRAHVEKIIRECDGNALEAARILGIGKTTIYRYMKKWRPKTNFPKPPIVKQQ